MELIEWDGIGYLAVDLSPSEIPISWWINVRDSEVFNEVRKVFIRVEINSSLGSDNLLLFETFSSMTESPFELGLGFKFCEISRFDLK